MGIGRKTLVALVLVVPVFGLAAGVAQAGSVGYQFRIAGNKNVPTFRLTNKSTSAEITSFTLTIGDTKFNFDFHRPYPSLLKINPEIGGTFDAPDLVQDKVRVNKMQVNYTDFQPGEFHRFKLDIDPDSKNKRIDYRSVLFDLGGNSSADNAKVTVNFSNGKTLSGYLPDYAGPNLAGKKYAYTQWLNLSANNPNPDDTSNPGGNDNIGGGSNNPPTPAVPLPAGVWAGLSMLGTLGAWRGAKRVLRTA